jgi:hypothetical protein
MVNGSIVPTICRGYNRNITDNCNCDENYIHFEAQIDFNCYLISDVATNDSSKCYPKCEKCIISEDKCIKCQENNRNITNGCLCNTDFSEL